MPLRDEDSGPAVAQMMDELADCVGRVGGTYDPAAEVGAPCYSGRINAILGEEGEDVGFGKGEMNVEAGAEGYGCVTEGGICVGGGECGCCIEN
jgi:hypothetical protein